MRIQDRGAARMQVRADDVGMLVDKMKAAGLRVASVGGGPVPIPPNFMGALVADPNGFFLTVIAPCPLRARLADQRRRSRAQTGVPSTSLRLPVSNVSLCVQ
jgi:hypothetical protein